MYVLMTFHESVAQNIKIQEYIVYLSKEGTDLHIIIISFKCVRVHWLPTR